MVGIAIDSRRAACACCTSPVQFDLTPILPYVAVDKDAFPSNPAQRAGCTKSFSLRKQARMSHVKIQAQSQLSFALRSQWRSSQKPSRSIGPAFLEPFNRAGSRFENSGLIRRTYGASDPEPNL